MRNRAIKVSLVKDEKNTLEPAPKEDINLMLQSVAVIAKSLGRDAAIAVLSYVVLDTVRQVAVAKASK